jgi:hypothetical protein
MKKLVMVCLVLAGCGTNPYQQELDAYKSYLQGEVSSGRMSLSEGNYRLLQKQNELNTQRQANMANSAAMGAYGLGMMNASRPQPIPTNSVNCSSIQQGAYVNTRCQ